MIQGAVADSQYASGLNQGSTELAFMSQTAAEGAGEAQKLSSVTLFIDISSAFAEVQRCLVSDDFRSREKLSEALRSYGLGGDIVQGIIDEVSNTGFWAENGAPLHLERMLQACLDNLYATFEGIPQGCVMHQGTGAGNPLADLLFALAMSKVIQMLRRKLREAGLLQTLTIQGARQFLGIGPVGSGDDIV